MSAPAPPPDHSVELARMEQEAARQERERQAAESAAKSEKLAGLRSNASTAARGSAKDYFTSQGLEADQYSNPINSFIDQILAGISPDDPNPGSYFNDVGQRVYGQQETGYQNKENRLLDSVFSPDFETKRIPFTLDDPYLSSIEEEKFGEADNVIRNMLDRGVITNTGYGAALGDLNKQRSGAKARLNEIGTGQIAAGQSGLRGVANNARSAASKLHLGQQFDPFSYGTEADSMFNDWIGKLGDNIRAAAPGDLFKTGGLAALAGSAQGAGNTAFNPLAAAGVIQNPDDEDPRDKAQNVF